MKELGKEIGHKIDFENIGERIMNIQEIHNVVAKSGLMRAGSWAFRNAIQMVKDKVYRFTVSGHHHKGHVYIVLGWMDTFRIYYTSNQGTIKKIEDNIYIDVLIDTLDVSIERIARYAR
jgi:hypothetical protein